MALKRSVGGPSFAATDEGLHDALAAHGGGESAQVVSGPRRRSRGFGFVEMASPDYAGRATRVLSGPGLDGRTLGVETGRGASAPRRR